MSSLINRIQRALLTGAGPSRVRALLTELAIPAGGSGGTMQQVRKGVLRPISDEAVLRDALENIGLEGDGGGGRHSLADIRNAIIHNKFDSETTLRNGLNGLLYPEDFAAGAGGIPAVHFDGETDLRIASLSTGDNISFVAFSMWFKTSQDIGSSNPPFWTMASPGTSRCFLDQSVIPSLRTLVAATLYNAAHNKFLYIEAYPSNVADGKWHHVLFGLDTANTVGCLYIDDVDVTDGVQFSTGGAFTLDFNGVGLWCFSDGDVYFNGDVADFWFAPGQNILAESTITEETRRKFISSEGKPVDLGEDGSTPTGTAPAVFFSGNAEAFSTNRGTGGSFTLNGALTNASARPGADGAFRVTEDGHTRVTEDGDARVIDG